jgi:tetratricopeptide (TPR) repeat protein
MKSYLLCALVGLTLSAALVAAQTKNPATIPEEARRHFVIGTTLFTSAKSADDFSSCESEFKQAVDLAPQWPDARYNLALAREAAGDYAGAMADLKLYLQFQLPDAEARKAQDKIYVLEAKQQKKVTDAQAAKVDATARAEEAKYSWLKGEWSYESEFQGWGPNYGAATGAVRAVKIGNIVEFSPINSYSGHEGDLRATVGESGNVSWDWVYDENYSTCNRGHIPVALTVGYDQRTIRFQVDSWSGAKCNSNLPFIVTLKRR